MQHGIGYASATNCLMVRFNLVIRGRLDDVRVNIPYRVYLGFSVNIIIPIGYTLTMMIVTHSRSTIIIVIRYMYFTQLTNWLTKQLTKWEPIDEEQKEKEHTLARVLFRTANRTILLPVKVIIAPDLHKRKGKEKEPVLSH